MKDFETLNKEIKSLEQDAEMRLQLKESKGELTQDEETELNQKLLLLIKKNKELQNLIKVSNFL